MASEAKCSEQFHSHWVIACMCVCVCNVYVLAGIIWPTQTRQSPITSSLLAAVYFIDSHVFVSFLCLRAHFFPFLSPVSSSVSITLFSQRSVKTRRWFLRRRTWEIDALDAHSPPSVGMLIAVFFRPINRNENERLPLTCPNETCARSTHLPNTWHYGRTHVCFLQSPTGDEQLAALESLCYIATRADVDWQLASILASFCRLTI